mmetsp:Transcript_20731/g.41094  ORF Transcript_20731/g.41094 Transcript_20731/m.41094 type:complete len:351 (-) Transcript_20731:168-1220(-)
MKTSIAVFMCGVVATVEASPLLIIDTDFGGGGCADVDDVAALCAMHALADSGEVELLAIIQDTAPAPVAGAISVVNTYYGRGSLEVLPIGAYKGTDLDPDGFYLSYVDDLLASFPSEVRNSSMVPDSTDVYRSVLSKQADHSVTISSIGLLTAIKALLESPPDEYSALNGVDLVAQKVKQVAVMGGKYPTSADDGPECNFCGGGRSESDSKASSAATAFVVQNMPPSVEVVFSGFELGVQVQSGGLLSSCTPATNPCRAAFESYSGGEQGQSRYSWDPLSTLASVLGGGAASCEDCDACDGSNSVDANTGDNNWVFSGFTTNQTFLVLANATAAGDSLDALLCQPPSGFL